MFHKLKKFKTTAKVAGKSKGNGQSAITNEKDNLIKAAKELKDEKLYILLFYAKFLKSQQENESKDLSADECKQIRDLIKFLINEHGDYIKN